jgi:transposase
MARPAGALWRLEEYASAVQPLGKAGVWERVFQHLAADGNNEYAMIDSTIVRAHQHSAGALKKS